MNSVSSAVAGCCLVHRSHDPGDKDETAGDNSSNESAKKTLANDKIGMPLLDRGLSARGALLGTSRFLMVGSTRDESRDPRAPHLTQVMPVRHD